MTHRCYYVLQDLLPLGGITWLSINIVVWGTSRQRQVKAGVPSPCSPMTTMNLWPHPSLPLSTAWKINWWPAAIWGPLVTVADAGLTYIYGVSRALLPCGNLGRQGRLDDQRNDYKKVSQNSSTPFLDEYTLFLEELLLHRKTEWVAQSPLCHHPTPWWMGSVCGECASQRLLCRKLGPSVREEALWKGTKCWPTASPSGRLDSTAGIVLLKVGHGGEHGTPEFLFHNHHLPHLPVFPATWYHFHNRASALCSP